VVKGKNEQRWVSMKRSTKNGGRIIIGGFITGYFLDGNSGLKDNSLA